MDALTFFQAILPTGGITYLVLFPTGKEYKIHKPYDSLESMAEAAESYSRDPGYTAVYHACSNFKNPHIEVEKDGRAGKRFRVKENWNKAKAFWLDIDCGEKYAEAGKGYTTRNEAWRAVIHFKDEIGWPTPMAVSSGNGLHVYWPLDKPTKVANWLQVASLLKAATSHFKLLADPTRTADFASILRPVGTLNRKDPANPKRVDTKSEVRLFNLGALASSIHSVAKEAGFKLDMPARPSRIASGLNSDLTGHLEHVNIPSLGEAVAVSCAQVRLMRDTQGDIGYEHWRGVIGVLKHCVDGRELARDWSAERANTGHSQLDWDAKYDTWDAGPTTCDFFDRANDTGCSGCPYKGKVKSPIVLGRLIPASVETVVEVDADEQEPETVTVPAMPIGYQWDNSLLIRVIPDKDGIQQPHPFAQHLFYPVARIRGEDGAYKIGLRMHLHNNKVRDFQMSFEAMASQSDMLKSLAKYELMQTNHKDSGIHLTAYLRDSLEQLKKRVDETNTLTTFGWKDNMKGFLCGDRYYHQDGSVRRVLLGGYAATKAAALGPPVGTVEGYAIALNHVYNRPGMVPMQYALCSGWGSILNSLCEELYCGLPIGLTGGDSGKGKTTVAYASLYAFGDANHMAMKSDEAGTRNAIWATVGTFNNLPMLFDEMTNSTPEELSKFAYTLSLGEEKARLQATGAGVKFAAQSTWRMSPFITANKDLHGTLAALQANSQAEAVRMLQIRVDRYAIPELEPTEVQEALEQMRDNRGCAGEALIRYVVQNLPAVRDRVRKKLMQLAPDIPGTKYRYYRSHGACTLVACEIMFELRVAKFQEAEVRAFGVKLMQELAETIAVTNTLTSEDAFSRMVAHLTAGIVVTSDFQDARGGIMESPRNRINGPIVGRYVLGTHSNKTMAGRLFLCQKSIREWCTNNRTDFSNIIEHLRSAGALLSENEKVTLTRGTDLPRVQQRCVVIDTAKLDAAVPILVVDNFDGGQAVGL